MLFLGIPRHSIYFLFGRVFCINLLMKLLKFSMNVPGILHDLFHKK